ncbi:MAG: tripartite tricarboxylate transporter substrate binding protein, partial [Proteobacteria bacterium]|nr:tripartite tricarboxylate transporter substrate binding protein [Pseudomonadota bacterium]
ERGAEPVGNSAAEFAGFFRDESARWGGVAKAANVKVE